jgi:hypothetical protein
MVRRAAGVDPAAGDGSERRHPSHPGGYLWAELMQRMFGLDVLGCPRCGGWLRLLALIEHARIVVRILRHLSLPTERPELRPARALVEVLDLAPSKGHVTWAGDEGSVVLFSNHA